MTIDQYSGELALDDNGRNSIGGPISNTEIRSARLDASTHALEFIDYEHHEIHAGSHFFIDGYFTGLSSGTTKAFGFHGTSGGKEFHMRFSVDSTVIMQFEIYRATSTGIIYTGGTAVTPLNSNDVNTNTSEAIVVSMPDHKAAGTSVRIVGKVHGTSGVNPANPGQPGSGTANSELIFNPAYDYLILFTALNNSCIINYTGFWYEHTPRD